MNYTVNNNIVTFDSQYHLETPDTFSILNFNVVKFFSCVNS